MNDSKALKAGKLLVTLACGISLIPVPGFSSWLIAGPLFLASFILAAISLSRGERGIGLLLSSMIAGPAFVAAAPFVTTLGLACVHAYGQGKKTERARRIDQKHYATAAEAQQAVLRRYPDLGDINSKFNIRFREAYTLARVTRPGLLKTTTWPVVLAEEVSEALNPAPPLPEDRGAWRMKNYSNPLNQTRRRW